MTQSELIDRLESELSDLLKLLRTQFVDQAPEVLLQRPASDQWNAQECFAHLNAQFDYYLPRIELALHKAKARNWTAATNRQSNGMGLRAIRAVDPENRSTRPRKSPKSIHPSKLLAVRENELKVFLINLEMMLRLLRQARAVDLNKPRVKPMRWSLSSFVLGDLFEYLVRHAQRHALQAQAAVFRSA